MKPAELAPELCTLARARGYAVLADLLLHGARGCDPRMLAAIVPLAIDGDALAAQYVAAFDLGVPPYASTFLEPDGIVGGEVTRAAVDAIQAAGHLPVTDEVGACHLGVLLGHAGRLCAAGRDRDAARFVAGHVLPWLPIHVVALEQIEVPQWNAVVRMALDVVVEHCEQAALPAADAITDANDDPLRDPTTGLREVAGWLGSAARCGLFLTDTECARIGRALDLPRGFGSRRDRIETLLRSAAEYTAVVPLCDALDAVAAQRHTRLQGLAAEWRDATALGRWLVQIAGTRRMLATLRAGATGAAAERELVP